MSNWVDVHLDVLASSPTEINQIEAALQEPCEELLAWVAKKWGKDPKEIAADVKDLVSFTPKHNLGYVDPSVNKARRFHNSFKDRSWGIVWSHVDFVSRDFPEALFLGEHWNSMSSSASRRVIRAGQEIRSVYDGNQQAQSFEWVLPNIFAPYWTEYELGLQYGSLWDQWLSEMQSELASLKTYYGGSNDDEPEAEFETAADAAERHTMLTDPSCAKCGERFHTCAVCHDWFCGCVKPDSTCDACSKPSGIPSFMLNIIANQQEEVDDGEDFDRAADAAEHDEGLLTDAQLKVELDQRVVGCADPNWDVDCDDEIPAWHKASDAAEANNG
jgi:hypothetical protein